MSKINHRCWRTIALCCAFSISATAAPAKQAKPKDPLEPARAALRTLRFSRAIELLSAASNAGNADARYILALIYLNGVGIAPDPVRARALLQSAAELGQGAAAFVLAGELTRAPDAAPGSAQQWLERSAKLGYGLATQALHSGRALLERESVGASEPALLSAWVVDCARKNDAAELHRLGARSIAVHDEFGRGPLIFAAEAGSAAAATELMNLGADPRAADAAGVTALMVAAERPNSAMTELLLQRGADPLATDVEQRTALFYAARSDRPATVLTLQHAGVLLSARDRQGHNALDAAQVVGAEAAAAQLRSLGLQANEVGARIERQNGKFDPARPGDIYRGWPPLALVVSRNDTASVRQQLDAGGNAN